MESTVNKYDCFYRIYWTTDLLQPNFIIWYIIISWSILCTKVPTCSPSCGGDVKVCVLGPFNYISFHKFSWQLSTFLFCCPSLISTFLVHLTFYPFIKVSLNGLKDPARLLCTLTCVRGGRNPGDWGTRWLRSVLGQHISLAWTSFRWVAGLAWSNQSAGHAEP